MEMTGDFRANVAGLRLVAKHNAKNDHFVFEAPAAMVGEAGIMIADNPCPVEPVGEFQQQLPCRSGKAITAEAVVETVAQAVEARRTGPLHFARKGRQRRM